MSIRNKMLRKIMIKGQFKLEKIIFSPSTYIQGTNKISNLQKYVNDLGKNKVYIITDEFIYKNYKNKIVKSFEENNIKYNLVIFNSECCFEEIEKYKQLAKDYNIIIGIGGGKVLDFSKAVSYYTDYPVIIVPTVASTDASCSRLSAIYTKEGQFLQYITLRNSPNIVLVDIDIIIKAPVRFLIAGIGDALSTYYETEACYKSNSKTMTGGYVTNYILTLSKLCKDTLLKNSEKAINNLKEGVYSKELEEIIEANIYLSGIGFENGGLSVAHALHNGLTTLKDSYKSLHGEKIAFTTIIQLALENREELKDIINFCKKIGLPTNLKELGINDITDNELIEAIKVSFDEKYTIKNVPFKITEESVLNAIKLVESLKE